MPHYLFVDNKGRVRSAEDEQILRGLGVSAPRTELETFAVNVLGFVSVRCRLAQLRLVLRPLLVTGEAVAGTCLLLAEREPARIAISAANESGGWTDAICGNALAAMRTIEGLVGGAPKPGAYLTIERPVQQLAKQPRSDPLAAVFRLWRSKLGCYDDDTERRMDALTAPALSSVFETVRRSHRLLIRRWGASTFYSPEWNRQSLGRDIEDQPDRDYGRRVAANMRRCAMSGDPTLHEVDAVVADPSGIATQLTYRRLVLRWEGPAGSELVTTTSLVSDARKVAG